VLFRLLGWLWQGEDRRTRLLLHGHDTATSSDTLVGRRRVLLEESRKALIFLTGSSRWNGGLSLGRFHCASALEDNNFFLRTTRLLGPAARPIAASSSLRHDAGAQWGNDTG
jgi:hypothetical protein